MPRIEIREETLAQLQELAEPLVDTFDTLIMRLVRVFKEHADSAKANGGRRKDRSRERARKGEKTPNQAYYRPILRVLREAGGELRAGEVVDRVGELMEDRLNDVDRARLKSGEVRWRNTVRFARNDLVKQGALDADAPPGVWRLSSSEEG